MKQLWTTKRALVVGLLALVSVVWAAQVRLAPDAILAQAGFSVACTLADIDEDPDSSDGTWCVANNNNTNTSLRVSFPTPPIPTRDGVNLQEFRCLFRPVATCGTGTATASIALWENGVLISTSTTTNITAASGEVVKSYTWDATGRTDSLIEAECIGTRSGGAGAVRCAVDIGAVEWNVEVRRVIVVD